VGLGAPDPFSRLELLGAAAHISLSRIKKRRFWSNRARAGVASFPRACNFDQKRRSFTRDKDLISAGYTTTLVEDEPCGAPAPARGRGARRRSGQPEPPGPGPAPAPPPAPRRAPQTKIIQGWPKFWGNFKALIGIFSQIVGPSLAIWANPVQFSFQAALPAALAGPCRALPGGGGAPPPPRRPAGRGPLRRPAACPGSHCPGPPRSRSRCARSAGTCNSGGK
jgi:hypothetical protein